MLCTLTARKGPATGNLGPPNEQGAQTPTSRVTTINDVILVSSNAAELQRERCKRSTGLESSEHHSKIITKFGFTTSSTGGTQQQERSRLGEGQGGDPSLVLAKRCRQHLPHLKGSILGQAARVHVTTTSRRTQFQANYCPWGPQQRLSGKEIRLVRTPQKQKAAVSNDMNKHLYLKSLTPSARLGLSAGHFGRQNMIMPG